jgi:hypothetical protein
LAQELEAKLSNDEAFRANFDRESPLFHNGITTAVPTAGLKPVPKGMEADADWMSMPEVAPATTAAEVDYGEEYNALMKRRGEFDALKRALSAITTHTAAVLRYRQQKEDAVDAKDEEMTAKWLKFLRREVRRRNEAMVNAEAHYDVFDKASTEEGQGIAAICERAKQTKMDKAEHAEFSSFVKEHTTRLFRDCNDMLQEIKALKKAHKESVAGEKENADVDEVVAAVDAVAVSDEATQ